MSFRRLLMLVCLLIVGLTSIIALPAAAQNACAIRTDWPTYTVVRGDTLYRISRRFNTSVNALVSANCLPNASRIFAGQQLRVPPTSSGQQPPGSYDIPSTFQQYERGFMIWRGDTGDILVFTGTTQGNFSRYASQSYGSLPENPVPDVTPAGRVRPIMGFGRLWGNFIPVRTALGWPTASERSFVMRYSATGGQFYMSLPDSRTVVASGGTWSIYGGTIPVPIPVTPVPPTPQPSDYNRDTQASFQPFENGFMIWRVDTSEIAVYFGLSGGNVSIFSAVSYSTLPDNPFYNPPAGRIRPIWGIGRVWGNNEWVRSQLGWATGPEQYFTAQFRLVPNSTNYTFTIPDGRYITNTANRFWTPTGGSQQPPPPIPTATYTPAPQPTVITISAAYELFENGFMIWRSDNGRIDMFGSSGYLAGFNQDQYSGIPDNPVTDQPPANRVKPINGFGRVWGNFADVRSLMGWGLGTEQAYQATITSTWTPDVLRTCMNLPDGRYIQFPYIEGRSWTWQYVNSCS